MRLTLTAANEAGGDFAAGGLSLYPGRLEEGLRREELSSRGLESVAIALSGGRYDGFKRPADTFDFEEHRQHILQVETYPGAGPFGGDKGLRIATILDLDVTSLTRHDIENLVSETVAILHAAAEQNLP